MVITTGNVPTLLVPGKRPGKAGPVRKPAKPVKRKPKKRGKA